MVIKYSKFSWAEQTKNTKGTVNQHFINNSIIVLILNKINLNIAILIQMIQDFKDI
jgi:hypothetical protein